MANEIYKANDVQLRQQIKAHLDEADADIAALVSDDAYGSGWNGVTDIAPSQNAVYDKIETITPNATHTGEVTGATALTVDKTAISNRSTVTVAAADTLLIGDADDSNNLKKIVASDFVPSAGNTTIDGVKTFSSGPIIPDEAYGIGWDGVLEPPTKNAIYDKMSNINCVTLWTDNLANDSVWVYDFGTQQFNGCLTIVSSNGARYAVVAFRAASSSAFCTIITGTGITATTGVLTGTTAPSGGVIVSAHTNNSIYIQNRSGGTLHFNVGVQSYWLID